MTYPYNISIIIPDCPSKEPVIKIVFIALGGLSLTAGVIGIFIPGLPTTPFLLLSASLFAKSSERLHNWIVNHKVFGKYIREYREKKAIRLKYKVISLVMMWTMIGVSMLLHDHWALRIVIGVLGAVGTFVLLRIPTMKEDSKD